MGGEGREGRRGLKRGLGDKENNLCEEEAWDGRGGNRYGI